MKLYLIVSRKQVDVNRCVLSLQAAARQKNLEFELIVTEDTAFETLRNQQFEAGSLLYRVSTGSKAKAIESLLVHLYPKTFTTLIIPHVVQTSQTALQELAEEIRDNVGVIPTLIVDDTWCAYSAEVLTEKAATLGGFPIIIKRLGLSHGQGVQRIETAEDLQAKIQSIDFDSSLHVLRRYLAKHRNFRIIVVDNKVVAAIEYFQPVNDFRTNAAHDLKFAALNLSEIDPKILDMSLRAVANRSALLGGVDILIDEAGVPYVAEENVPCNFARAEEPTGVNIGLLIVEAMLRLQESTAA